MKRMKTILRSSWRTGLIALVVVSFVVLLRFSGGANRVDPEAVFRLSEIVEIQLQGSDENSMMVDRTLEQDQRDKWLRKLKLYSRKSEGGGSWLMKSTDGGGAWCGNMYLVYKSGEYREISMWAGGGAPGIWNADDFNGSLCMDGASYHLGDRSGSDD